MSQAEGRRFVEATGEISHTARPSAGAPASPERRSRPNRSCAIVLCDSRTSLEVAELDRSRPCLDRRQIPQRSLSEGRDPPIRPAPFSRSARPPVQARAQALPEQTLVSPTVRTTPRRARTCSTSLARPGSRQAAVPCAAAPQAPRQRPPVTYPSCTNSSSIRSGTATHSSSSCITCSK
jgi:hypothetical protein